MHHQRLTWNANVFLLVFSLRVGKEQYDLLPGARSQNAQILTDAFFTTSFGFCLCQAGREDDALIENRFLKVYTI